MAFGIRLTRGKSGVANLEPSDFYIGSYSGPPDFQTLAPGESFKSDICLQYFLPQGRKLPLPEGDYQLWIAFDSTKFAGVNPKGTEIACRFDANPIAFSIKGAARTDPEELLRLIGEKVGLNSLRVDLASSNRAEQDQAWQAVVKYGDSRLVPFLQGSTLPSVQRLYSRGQLEPYVQPYDPLSRW
ncbi:MAG TPA: hypothetical protein VGY55_12805 [Pirellulales bacterium]|nr:hypothetical protein [Pirellulales bacterium]